MSAGAASEANVAAATPAIAAARESAFVRAAREAFAREHATLPGAELPVIAAARADAMARFAAAGLPDARHEAWKYTVLRALAQRSPVTGDAEAPARAVDAAAWMLPGDAAARLVFVNGVLRADLSDLAPIAAPSVRVQSLAAAVGEADAELLATLAVSFGTPGAAFAALNTALWRDGCVVRVADGAQVAAPLHLVFVGATLAEDAMAHVRHVVRLGAGASLRLIEHHVGAAGSPTLNVVTQIELGAGARLAHERLQMLDTGATLIARTQATLAQDAEYTPLLLDMGAQLARHDLHVALAASGAATRVTATAIVNGRQHADLQLRVDHRVGPSSSRVAFRGIADQRARSVLGGAIVVQPGADGADAALSCRNLLLSPHAEIDAKPELEIHADEVKAAHGATVGQLDERALFYLRSRGLPLAQARAMLTFAFVREMLDGIDDPQRRDHVAKRVSAHLPALREEGPR